MVGRMQGQFWHCEWAPTADEWMAFWAFCTLLATVAAATVALLQLQSYVEDRFERSGPFVLADFHLSAGMILEVVLQNYSKTPAIDVQLRVVPPSASNLADRAAA